MHIIFLFGGGGITNNTTEKSVVGVLSVAAVAIFCGLFCKKERGKPNIALFLYYCSLQYHGNKYSKLSRIWSLLHNRELFL